MPIITLFKWNYCNCNLNIISGVVQADFGVSNNILSSSALFSRLSNSVFIAFTFSNIFKVASLNVENIQLNNFELNECIASSLTADKLDVYNNVYLNNVECQTYLLKIFKKIVFFNFRLIIYFEILFFTYNTIHFR